MNRAGQIRPIVFLSAAPGRPGWKAGYRWWDDSGRLVGYHVLAGYDDTWEAAARRALAAVRDHESRGHILGGTAVKVRPITDPDSTRPTVWVTW